MPEMVCGGRIMSNPSGFMRNPILDSVGPYPRIWIWLQWALNIEIMLHGCRQKSLPRKYSPSKADNSLWIIGRKDWRHDGSHLWHRGWNEIRDGTARLISLIGLVDAHKYFIYSRLETWITIHIRKEKIQWGVRSIQKGNEEIVGRLAVRGIWLGSLEKSIIIKDSWTKIWKPCTIRIPSINLVIILCFSGLMIGEIVNRDIWDIAVSEVVRERNSCEEIAQFGQFDIEGQAQPTRVETWTLACNWSSKDFLTPPKWSWTIPAKRSSYKFTWYCRIK